MLPDIYRTIDIFIMITIGFVMYGWAVFMIMDAIEGRLLRPVKFLGDVAVLGSSILLIGFVFVACALIVPFLIGNLAELRENQGFLAT